MCSLKINHVIVLNMLVKRCMNQLKFITQTHFMQFKADITQFGALPPPAVLQLRLSVEATDDSPEGLTTGGRAAGDEFQRTMGAFFAIYWLFRHWGEKSY